MSKGFAKYVILGNTEDLAAFESVMNHIRWCIMTGSSRDITLSVDGDGSANLHFFCDEEEDKTLTSEKVNSFREVEYPKEIRDKMFNCEEIMLKTGTIESDGSGRYCIGE